MCRGGGGSLCVCVYVCVRSQGFDTAIQALRLPWSRPPYMAIGVKEQREWAVWGSTHTHTHTHTGRMWRISLLRDAESMTPRPQKNTPTIPDYPEAPQQIQASRSPASPLSLRIKSNVASESFSITKHSAKQQLGELYFLKGGHIFAFSNNTL